MKEDITRVVIVEDPVALKIIASAMKQKFSVLESVNALAVKIVLKTSRLDSRMELVLSSTLLVLVHLTDKH